MLGIRGLTVTGPSQSPANVFIVSNDFCASVGAGFSIDLCISDCPAASCGFGWANAIVESDSRTTLSKQLTDFMVFLLTGWHAFKTRRSAGLIQQCYT